MPVVNYLWNPLNDNIVREFDDEENTIADYTTEAGLHGNVVSQRRNGVDSVYHTDGQGSTLALTNAAGDVTDTYAYNAFGEVTARTGDTVNPFQFVGQKQYYRDEETGNYDVRQRPLSSRFGRWLSADPLRQYGDFHAFVYVRNRPISNFDPSGLADKPVACDWKDCEACIESGWKDDPVLKFIWEKLHRDPPLDRLWKKNCEPKIICCKDSKGECEKCERPGYFGSLTSGTQTIIVCSSRFLNYQDVPKSEHGRCGHLWETLRHELSHLFDQCTGLDPLKDKCDDCICDEYRAYTVSLQCKEGSVWWEINKARGTPFVDELDCLVKSVAGSCDGACPFIGKTDAEIRKRVLNTKPKCKFPFGLEPGK